MPINPAMFRAAVRASVARRAARAAASPEAPSSPSPPSPMDAFLLKIALPLWVAFIFCFQLFGLLFRLTVYPYLVIVQLRNEGIPTGPFRAFSGQWREVRKLLKDWQSSTSPAVDVDCMPPDFFGQCHADRGPVFATTLGSSVHISLADPAIIHEAFAADGAVLAKAPVQNNERAVYGKGLLASERSLWAHQRKHIPGALLSQPFLKRLVRVAGEWAALRMDAWAEVPVQEVDASTRFVGLAFEVVVRAAFGPPTAISLDVAEKLFTACEAYRNAVAEASLQPPSLFRRFLPTATKRAIKREAAAIRATVYKLVMDRRKAVLNPPTEESKDLVDDITMEVVEEDFLGTLLSAGAGKHMTTQQMADECTTVLFAGYDKIAQLMTWAAMLLAVNPEWQDRAREEVISVCGPSDVLTWNDLPRLKIVESILFETLRLFPAVPTLLRKCQTEMKVGKLTVQKECVVSVPLAYLQRSEALWGSEAERFQPERFTKAMDDAATPGPVLALSPVACASNEEIEEESKEGSESLPVVKKGEEAEAVEGCQRTTAEAGCSPGAFLSFGVGRRSCPGRALALVEAKALIVTLLQRFTLKLSPGYRHEPAASPVTALRPLYGMPIVLAPLSGLSKAS